MSTVLNILKILTEFPGGPVVRTQHFHCQAWVQSLIKELNPISFEVQPKNEKERVKEKKRQIILMVAVAFSFPHHSEASANT